MLVKLGLGFRTEVDEQAFVDSFILGPMNRTRFAMLVGCVVYYAFSLWDWLVDPVAWPITHLIRASVVGLVLLPTIALTFWTRMQPYTELLLLVFCVVPAVCLSVIYGRLSGGFTHGAAGMVIIILFVSTLLPMRSPYFATFGAFAWIAFAFVDIDHPGSGDGLRIVNNFYICTALALALYSVIVREIQARHQFKTTAALQRAQRKTASALSELQQAKTSLLQAEKLAALGQIVSGVAHEINTPVGNALTTSTTLEREVAHLADALESGRVLRSDLTRGISRLREGCRLLFANLTRAAELIGTFKLVAGDHARGERRTFALGAWLGDLVISLEPLRKKEIEVSVQCLDHFELETYPEILAQVVGNLLINCVTHAYPDRGGLIRLLATQPSADTMRIVVADEGVGIASDHLDRVFDPFFTTRRGQGSTGLGLHIVHNLVTSTLQGRLEMQSESGVGTRFVIDLPLRLAGSGQGTAGSLRARPPT